MEYTNTLLSSFFKAIAHPMRLQILRALQGGAGCVCDFSALLDSEQSNTSQHLSILKQNGILESYREGTRTIYTVVDPRIYQVLDLGETIIRDHIKALNTIMNV